MDILKNKTYKDENYKKQYEEKIEDIKNEYDIFFDGIIQISELQQKNIDLGLIPYHYVVEIGHRLVLAGIVIYMDRYPILQDCFIILLHSILFMFLKIYSPYQKKIRLIRDFITEINLIAVNGVCIFTL